MSYEYTISQLEEIIYFIEDGIGTSPEGDKEIEGKVKEIRRAISRLKGHELVQKSKEVVK
jgi:hypothetical protein